MFGGLEKGRWKYRRLSCRPFALHVIWYMNKALLALAAARSELIRLGQRICSKSITSIKNGHRLGIANGETT